MHARNSTRTLCALPFFLHLVNLFKLFRTCISLSLFPLPLSTPPIQPMQEGICNGEDRRGKTLPPSRFPFYAREENGERDGNWGKRDMGGGKREGVKRGGMGVWLGLARLGCSWFISISLKHEMGRGRERGTICHATPVVLLLPSVRFRQIKSCCPSLSQGGGGKKRDGRCSLGRRKKKEGQEDNHAFATRKRRGGRKFVFFPSSYTWCSRLMPRVLRSPPTVYIGDPPFRHLPVSWIFSVHSRSVLKKKLQLTANVRPLIFFPNCSAKNPHGFLQYGIIVQIIVVLD